MSTFSHFNAISFNYKSIGLDYYNKKENTWVASYVGERRKIWDLKKVGNFKKIPEMLGIEGEKQTGQPKGKF